MEHTRVNTPQYVCFNQKSGEIYSIGASIEEGYQYFEVSLEEVLPIKTPAVKKGKTKSNSTKQAA